MSLIQEALKRQKDASGGDESSETKTPPRLKPSEDDARAVPSPEVTAEEPPAPAAHEPPAAPKHPPPPLPLKPRPPDPKPVAKAEKKVEEDPEHVDEPETRPEKEKSPRAWPVLVAAIVIVLFLIGGAVWIGVHALQRAQPSSEAAPAVEITPIATPPDRPPRVTPRPAEPPAGEPAAPAAAPSPVASAEEPARPTQTDRPEATAAAPARPPVNWPRLSLEGVVGQGRMGAAKINGKIIGVGESIEGAVLVSLDKKGVTLECRGERQFLKLGTTID